MNLASKNLRAVLGIGLSFLAGAAAFAIVLEVINLSSPHEPTFPLIPAAQRQTGALDLPVLGDAASAPPWHLQDQTGKVVVVNYFATWCGPCNDEEPELRQIYRDYSAKGVVFVAVGIDRDTDRTPPVPREQVLRQFATLHALPFPILLPSLDKALTLESDVVPQTYLYDRHGRLARWIEGAITRQNLRHSLDELLAEP